MKKQVGKLNAVPSKRLFLSIIADYDLNKSICELIDNAFDMWTRNGRTVPITVEVALDREENRIVVSDNAGGVARDDLTFIVGPGQSGSDSTDDTIGIFGVGTKRAVVALAKDIRIITRIPKSDTYQVEFDDGWLDDEDWELPLFQVAEASEGTTRVELARLRVAIDVEAERLLRSHLSATYAKFLVMPNVVLSLNGEPIEPRFFDQWSYPPDYGPRRYSGNLRTPLGREVALEVLAGLSNESSPASGEYGVYFYCNDRLVAPAMKSIDVGFAKGLAGLPHPKISLTKVIVSIKGDAGEMPWNSSKSEISTNHHTFLALHKWLVNVVSDYARISRIWMGSWPEKVFAHQQGTITELPISEAIEANRSFLPDAPASRLRLPERVAKTNQKIAKRKPWVVGLYEGVVAAVGVAKQPLDHANWLALNLLEVTLTGTFKAWLVNECEESFSNAQLRTMLRDPVPSAKLQKIIPLSSERWAEIAALRRHIDRLTYGATAPVVRDEELASAERLIKGVLKTLFKVETDA
ncbi:ATP-binding protein [Alteraurantiacibacter buctensis]|uniref:ATP-binding protein n=1 Tax=Alteraurantiacibacter buctensis TaxID=1503981 RepID=A0A844YTU8_9SPHN|nr:ATP-binding protein [Alteraurantiacibacter buctensis]MXO70288.1 hypothetical protein [Alteraurantiacibacter buctensis]